MAQHRIQHWIAHNRTASLLTVIVATYVIWVFIAMAIVVIISQGNRPLLLWTSLSVIGSLAIQQVVGVVWFRSRPFVRDVHCPNLIQARAGTKSFPSDHAAVSFAIATVMTIDTPELWPMWYLLASTISLGRYFAGAHYVTDIVAGALTGTVFAYGVMRFLSPLWLPMYTPLS